MLQSGSCPSVIGDRVNDGRQKFQIFRIPFTSQAFPASQSERTESGIDDPDRSDSDQKDLVQVDSSRRGPEQNFRTRSERSDPVHRRDEERHLEEDQRYMLRGKEYLGRLV